MRLFLRPHRQGLLGQVQRIETVGLAPLDTNLFSN
jgi:hypothetical protein